MAIYQVGDKVAHPGHGGCVVKEISEREFRGETKRYFVLVPKTEPNTTILAPVDNVERIGLRGIISEERADEILQYLLEAEVDWVSDHTKRRQTYEETLKNGDLELIAKMIKELKVHESHSKLNHSDKELLPKAQKRLFSEIALAKDIAFDLAVGLAQQAM
jgi:Transcriptional regulators, similar to M. xanthus CarD